MIFYSPITRGANITRHKPNITAKQCNSPQANRAGVISVKDITPFRCPFNLSVYSLKVLIDISSDTVTKLYPISSSSGINLRSASGVGLFFWLKS